MLLVIDKKCHVEGISWWQIITKLSNETEKANKKRRS